MQQGVADSVEERACSIYNAFSKKQDGRRWEARPESGTNLDRGAGSRRHSNGVQRYSGGGSQRARVL